jgi:hypothetical protein
VREARRARRARFARRGWRISREGRLANEKKVPRSIPRFKPG